MIGGYAREMRLEMNYAQFKRLMDIGISAIGLVVLSPIMLITALAIKLDSPGPVLYRQQRLGLNGKRLQCISSGPCMLVQRRVVCTKRRGPAGYTSWEDHTKDKH